MTATVSSRLVLTLFGAALLATPFVAGAQEISDPNQDKLSPRADLEQVITETTYQSAAFLKAKKAFSGWPAKWYIDDDGVLVMPGDRVVPDGAPNAFLKAKKAFDEVENPDDFEFVMPGDNVSDELPDNPELE